MHNHPGFLCLSPHTELADLDWHIITQEELYKRLNTSTAEGISSEMVKQRLAQYGRNRPSPPPKQWFRKIFGYFFGGFGAILLLGGVLVSETLCPLSY
jgi:sodium/potassium-transporting ATPase subunit alpha